VHPSQPFFHSFLAGIKITNCRNTLRAAATAAASNKGLFT